MANGNVLPFVSEDHVREVLDNLVQVSPHKSPNPLQFLLLIDIYLTVEANLPLIPDRRQFALNDIFIKSIIERYIHHRAVLGLNPPEYGSKLEQCRENISFERSSNSIEMLCWSWLYHHYVRVDLGLSRETYCEIVSIDERTLRRYQQQGIKRLTEHIIHLEAKARQEQRRRWLYTQIPEVVKIPLKGRDNELNYAEYLLHNQYPPHLQVTGAPGIGKTCFVGTILKNRIDADLVDRLVWISYANSPDFVRQQLCEKLLYDVPHLSLSEYCSLLRVTIIIEDVDIGSDIEAWEILLDEMKMSCVLITTRIYEPLLHCSYLALRELSKEAIFALLENQSLGESVISHMPSIWENSGGNPTAALLLMHREQFYFPKDITLNGLFSGIYEGVSLEVKRAWVIFALLPQKPVSAEYLTKIWQSYLSQGLIGKLLIYHLIHLEDHRQGYTLTNSARRFIEYRYQTDEEIQQIVSDLFEYLDTVEVLTDAFDIVETILTYKWVKITRQMHQHWISSLWLIGLKRGHYALWCELLKNQTDQGEVYSLELHIAYGICLRHLCQWHLSQEVFAEAVKSAGHLGLFRDQAHIFIEWAVLLRHQGQYTKSSLFLNQAENILSHHSDHQLLHSLHIEKAQIALDIGNLPMAEKILLNLPRTNLIDLLRCDFYFLKQDLGRLERLAQDLIPLLQEESSLSLAHLHTLLGKSSWQKGDFQATYHHFCTALTLLEKHESDFLALARVQSNVGAILSQLGRYTEAHDLLLQAKQSQIHLQDQLGLEVTQHNLRFLN